MKLIESKTISESNELKALSACLVSIEFYYNIVDELTLDHFYVRTSRVIFEAYRKVVARGDQLDKTNIEPLLTNDLVAQKKYLYLLEINVPEDEIQSIIAILKDKKGHRDLALIKSKVLSEIESEDSSSVILNRLSETIIKVNREQPTSVVSITDAIHDGFDLPELKEIEGLTGIPTGLKKLDRMTSGLQLGKTSVISGPTSDGKSSLAMQIAKHAAYQGFRVAGFSLEDSKTQFVNRMLANELKMDSYKVKHRRFNDTERRKAIKTLNKFNKLPIHIDDSAFHTAASIFNECNKLNFRHNDPVALIIIDFLQCISEDREMLSPLCRELQAYAKVLNAHIMEVSQWHRGREYRQADWQEAPGTGDNKGSSSIEQFAHTIFSITSPTLKDTGEVKSKPCIIWHLKGKDAITGPVPSMFHKYCYKFEERDEKDTQLKEFFS